MRRNRSTYTECSTFLEAPRVIFKRSTSEPGTSSAAWTRGPANKACRAAAGTVLLSSRTVAILRKTGLTTTMMAVVVITPMDNRTGAGVGDGIGYAVQRRVARVRL
jgi:hypothetical protein